MKISRAIIALGLAVLLFTGCTVQITLPGNDSQGSNTSDTANTPDEGDAADNTTKNTADNNSNNNNNNTSNNNADNTAENTVESAAPVTDGAPIVTENLTMPSESSYCRLNNSDVWLGYLLYCEDETAGEVFACNCIQYELGGLFLTIVVAVPDKKLAKGVKLRGDDIVLAVVDSSLTAFALSSVDNPDSFSNMEFCLYEYSEKKTSIWSLKADVVLPDGSALNIDIFGSADYMTQEQLAQLNEASKGDGTCTRCNGSGTCNICYGMGYYGDNITCFRCKGSKRCYYCEGTGIQVWLVEGVPVS